MVYRFWLFVHLGGLLLFAAGHGTSAAAGMRLRRERDPARMAALLDASASARGSTYAGMALLGAGGLADAFLGHWWSAGWVWVSVGAFLAMAAILVALAIPYYRRLRHAVTLAAAGGGNEEIDRLSQSPVPLTTLAVGLGGFGVILWLMVAVTGMLLLARSPSGGTPATATGGQAPGFTLASTAGSSVSLTSYRGRDVLLYFSEGVGCDSCFYQMVELEKNAQQLSAKGLTVLPIVANSAADTRRELARFGIKTPFLIDGDEQVSNAYGVVGTGMHANLPGHSFILVDASGRIQWRKDYPSMFVTVSQLLAQIGSKAG